MMRISRQVSEASKWEEFSGVVRQEAAERNQRLLAMVSALPVLFTAYDLTSVGGAVLETRLAINGGSLAVLGGLWLALGSPWGRRRVFELFFLLCALIMAANSYSLGEVSPASGRLAFHSLTILGLVVIALQWFWPWQLVLGLAATALFVRAIPGTDPDFGFFTLALLGASASTAVLASILTRWRYRQFVTEAELRRANEIEARQLAQLQAKNSELSDLLSVLSHDLRAPLINLEGFAAELAVNMGGLDRYVNERKVTRAEGVWVSFEPAAWTQRVADITEALQFIRGNVSKMGALVRGLLELSRIQARPDTRQLVDLKAIVREVLASLHYQIAEKRVEVSVEDLPAVEGDPLGLSQIFSNLVDNAIKYMKTDGLRRVEIGCERRNGTPVFVVRDSGLGIRPEDQDKVFRPFARVAGGEAMGDGMGLAIVRKIVERHGGAIWVESTPGVGSAFYFTLAESAGSPPEPPAVARAPLAAAPLH